MQRSIIRLKSRSMLWLIPGLLLLVAWTSVLAAGELSIPVGRVTGGGQVMTGGEYTVVGAAGQHDAGRLSSGNLRVNGGVIGEVVTQPQPPVLKPRAYLPITWHSYPSWVTLYEAEPNNLFNQANPISNFPALVKGSHDGEAGGGDVFSLSLDAGRIFDVSLFTGDVSGVQLLAYDAAGKELLRDYSDPFGLTFTTAYSGTYYVYVFSSPEAANNASYTLTIQMESSVQDIYAITAPIMDGEHVDQPPQVERTP